MNVILVIVDTLRYDHLGANGGTAQTPHLDRLAGESWVFDRVFIASYPTIPFRTDVITGRTGGPFHAWQPLAHDTPTFVRALAEAGRPTQLIHDTPHLVNGGHNFDWPFHAWTFIRGAEVDRPWIDDRTDGSDNWCRDPLFDVFGEKPTDSWPQSAAYLAANRNRKGLDEWNCAKLFAEAARFCRDNRTRDRFFLWIDSFDPHEPWDAPPEFVLKYDHTPGYDGRIDPRSFGKRVTPDTPEPVRRRLRAFYAAKVSWLDHNLGRLLDELDATGLSRNTAVILVADHGTNLGEHGLWAKGYPIRQAVGHIPLMIRCPGAGAGRCDAIAQPQDLTATILALAGVAPHGPLHGHDLLAVARGGTAPPRHLALAGHNAATWRTGQTLFTAFDGQWLLEVAARPEDSHLSRMGSTDYVEADHPDVVSRLHADALDEVQRRGTHADLMAWLRRGGGGPLPSRPAFDGWPGPSGYYHYFDRIFMPR